MLNSAQGSEPAINGFAKVRRDGRFVDCLPQDQPRFFFHGPMVRCSAHSKTCFDVIIKVADRYACYGLALQFGPSSIMRRLQCNHTVVRVLYPPRGSFTHVASVRAKCLIVAGLLTEVQRFDVVVFRDGVSHVRIGDVQDA